MCIRSPPSKFLIATAFELTPFSFSFTFRYYVPLFSCSGHGWGQTLAFGAATWLIGGRIHSKRAVSKATKKHQAAQKQLYTQYYKDVLALQTQNAELQEYAKQALKGQIDGQFESADIDNDNRVSRAEFNAYKKQYLAKHPEMAGTFPAFEEFDPDANGMVSKAEHDAYYAQSY